MKPHTEEQFPLQVKIPKSLHYRLTVFAAAEERTVRAYLIRALEQAIAKDSSRKGPKRVRKATP